ncbi:MAG: dual specificity protein phosphatase family protein [Nitrospirota bacterium]|nr:MAG: dual specificity protein phosphatase family protein [Nitrospirota bacterium]
MDVQWLTRHLSEYHILVACGVGFGRSPSIIIAYLCCMQGLSFEEAQDLATQKRPGTTPLPHLAFLIEQLKRKFRLSPHGLPKTFFFCCVRTHSSISLIIRFSL